MIEHTKKLVEEKFTTLGGYEHNAEVYQMDFSFSDVVHNFLNKVMLGMVEEFLNSFLLIHIRYTPYTYIYTK